MKYFNAEKAHKLKLTRDISKHIKQGNPWVFSDAVEKLKVPEGSYAMLVNHKNEVIAHGYYSSTINLAFRALHFSDKKFNDTEMVARMSRAISIKKHLLTQENKCFRIFNGEGDDLPGVVADYYQGVVVLKLDGSAAEAFWKKEEIANYFMEQDQVPVKCVYFKRKNNEAEKGMVLAGECSYLENLEFLENSVKFRTNV